MKPVRKRKLVDDEFGDGFCQLADRGVVTGAEVDPADRVVVIDEEWHAAPDVVGIGKIALRLAATPHLDDIGAGKLDL